MNELIKKSYSYITNMINMAIKKNRLSHAYIIEGEDGTPKKDIALYFAMRLYCPDVCLKCNNCINIMNLNHMNISYITNDGINIKTEAINKVINELSKKSMVDGPRVIIIENADRFNQSSANKLLKTIEEPFNDVYFLLLTSKIDQIIPTILSRCQIIHLNSLEYDDIKNELLNNGIEKKYANVLPYINNNYDACIDLLENESFDIIYKIVIELTKKISKYKESILYLKDNYYILDNKDNFNLFIKVLILYLADIIKAEKNLELIFDEKDNINKCLDNLDIIKKIFKELQSLEKRIDYGTNYLMALESILLEVE